MAKSTASVVDPPANALRESAAKARANGSGLLGDARLLFEAKRYARATALAILAEEEFMKSFLLDNASLQGRWDLELYEALSKHGIKLGLADGLRKMVRMLRPASNVITQHAALHLPSDDDLESLAKSVREASKKNDMNYLKQNAFYVGVERNGVCSSTPDDLSEADVLNCLMSAEGMRALVLQQLMLHPAVLIKHPFSQRY